jgi:hypothetical protein
VYIESIEATESTPADRQSEANVFRKNAKIFRLSNSRRLNIVFFPRAASLLPFRELNRAREPSLPISCHRNGVISRI